MSIITLNIRGYMYTTRKETLQQSPFFDGLLRSEATMQSCPFEGRVFVDRDGLAFKDILAFLRTGQPIVPSVPVQTLKVEADFYQIANFEFIQVEQHPKKLFLPKDMTLRQKIRGRFHERSRSGQERYVFLSEELPANVTTHMGSGGMKGCVYLKDLLRLHFRFCEPPSSQAAGMPTDKGVETDEDQDQDDFVELERIVHTHFVDLQEFTVAGAAWDSIEVHREESGQNYAIVKMYE